MEKTSKKIPRPGSPRKVSAVVGKGARAKTLKNQSTAFYSVAEVDPTKQAVGELGAAVMKLIASSMVPSLGHSDPENPPPQTGQRISTRGNLTQKDDQTGRPGKKSRLKAALAADQSAEENKSRYSDSRGAASTQSAQEVQPPPKVRARRKSRSSSPPAPALKDLPPPAPAAQQSVPKALLHWLSLARNYRFARQLKLHPRALAALAVVGLFLMGLLIGLLQSRTAPEAEAVTLAKPSLELVKELNAALALIDSGAADEALQKIQALSSTHPHVSSLDYLAALAALQAGDLETAQEKASLSISKNQKVSDSLVLLSIAESGGGAGENSGFRDLKIVRESLLREAVNTDVSNPSPMIELASFLRSQKRDDEALELLHAANARLHPIDTHVVVETSIQLMKLQQTPDHELPLACQEGSITEIFSSIYISLRKNDHTQASIALEKCRHQASPDLFAYIINDPVFKPFHAEPLMMKAL